MVFPFVLTALVLLMDVRLIGSGEELILLPFLDNPSVMTLVYLFVSKLVLLGVAFGSGIPGGSIQYLLPIAIVTYIAYFVAEVCQSKPVYESLLGLMVND